MTRRCPYCGGVYDPISLDGFDADEKPNRPCVCGVFEAEREDIEEHERGPVDGGDWEDGFPPPRCPT